MPPVQRLLDVGCSWGRFASEVAAAHGAEAWGIEPDPETAEVAATRLDRVIVGRFPDDIPSGETFDCVTFTDVLEHLVDPVAALAAARATLRPGGHVVASIPNVRHRSVLVPLLKAGRFDYVEAGILDRTHLRFFTRATMREMFESNGWHVERQEAVNVTPATGKWRFLRAVPGGEEFFAQQYVIVAS